MEWLPGSERLLNKVVPFVIVLEQYVKLTAFPVWWFQYFEHRVVFDV